MCVCVCVCLIMMGGAWSFWQARATLIVPLPLPPLFVDRCMEVEIDLVEALCGFEISIPTLDGRTLCLVAVSVFFLFFGFFYYPDF